MAANPDRQLDKLEASRYRFGGHEAAHVVGLLDRLAGTGFTDSASLIRFHEALLFLRAFPQGPAVVRATERILRSFHKKVEALCKGGANMDAFDTFEFSGIAGTQMEDTLGFDVARWVIRRMPGEVEIAWGNYDPGRNLGNTAPRFIPLIEDDAYVEADTPWRRWVEMATPGNYLGALRVAPKIRAQTWGTVLWIIKRFDGMQGIGGELYDSLRLPLRWTLGNSTISRTQNRKPVARFFYHNKAEGTSLISRREVSLAQELARHPPKLKKLSLERGEGIIELIREVMLVRYRELYGTTLGDSHSVVEAEVGRGVTIYLWNLPPDRRLPLRAYVAGLTLKNGVPINYIEAIGLCEWMEVGFNTFYTFRGGEAGWIYAQVLRCLCQHMGTTCVSVYPYQLGDENKEAIESGAFWFYRKLGFRPGRRDLLKLAEREEEKIAADKKYRTPARALKRLATGHVFYEPPGSEVGAWDRFSTRSIGLRVNQRMARDFGGDAVRMREHSKRRLERILSVSTTSWAPLERTAFENFAVVLAEIREMHAWTEEEKEGLVRIIRAKVRPDEMLYQKLTRSHGRLRRAMLKLGSPAVTGRGLKSQETNGRP
jgi:hypothetical protein